MGYRSDVAIAVAPEAVDRFLGFLATNEYMRRLLTPEMESDTPEKGALFFRIDYIRWYRYHSSDIEKFENFLFSLEEDKYRFVRVGDDSGDIEERGDFYDGYIFGSQPSPELCLEF